MCFFCAEALHRRAEQLPDLRLFEQAGRCLLQRGVVGNGLEPKLPHEVRHVFQQRDHAAIILPLVSLKHEQGEELVPGELLGAEAVRVSRQRRPRDRQSFQRHLPW